MGDELKDKYYGWMNELVSNQYRSTREYSKLIAKLNSIPFVYILRLDENRAADGVSLRYRFGYECGYSNAQIEQELDYGPSSIFEVMVALSLRCEDDIMGVPGDYHVDRWFWEMLYSLGLGFATDAVFDDNLGLIDSIIKAFLNHEYQPDGQGSLFTVPNCKEDLRRVEIWTQMNIYLNSIMTGGMER